ncbi:M23 family metallopeptidase [Pedobacter frigiditerrae]|uniref:M23 family metallopeptidase n=1 Tax=Pedobacter frigiditerrae TaxID=2530452 RepID=A0A4V2MJJ8_9SPHI|nr:M23 family metallopeptidase [Pedobacter frigiditerrae]TCC94446.1 M23 family metallopeptidase [Pedobacter frigiditerrae]
MAREKAKTTVIFVNKNQSAGKPIQIPSTYVEHWKKYFLGLIALFVLLAVIIGYLNYSKNLLQSSKDKLVQDLIRHKKDLSEIDTIALKKRYRSIDQKLLSINKFLKARGIKPILKDNVGGEESNDLIGVEEIGSYYDSYLTKILYNVTYTPIGYPHIGEITSGFGIRENPFTGENTETHKGLDIKGATGNSVKSTANGRVLFAGRRGGYGNCVVIDHHNGFQTYYGHLSKILVQVGQDILVGQKIGKIGSTGRSTGPHLHYEIHKNGKPISPRAFLTLE